jgi:hypothetical protein
MPHRAWLLALILMGLGACCWAEDAPKTEKKAEQKAPEPKTWTGQLGKTDQALASLKTHPESKEEKPLTLLLFVADPKKDAATVKQISEMLGTKPLPYVTVTGILGQDGKSVQVQSISTAEKPKKGKH